MVKVVAPAMSLDASGTLADTLVFSKWKGRNYIRQRVIPSNPKSGPQTGIRAMFKFLTENWVGMSGAEQAEWVDRAAETIISPFNAFLSYNMKRWRSFEAPSKFDPATEDGSAPVGTAIAPVGGVRQVTIGCTCTTANDIWAVALFRSPTGTYDTAWSNCIGIVLLEDTGPEYFVDSPLVAGTYYYDGRYITTKGDLGAELGEQSGTAT